MNSLYNLTMIESLADGNEELIHKVVGLFVDEIPVSVTEIETAFIAGDYKRVGNITHKIKPSFGNLGVISIKEELKELETLATQGIETEKLKELIKKVKNTSIQIVDALREEVLYKVAV